MPWYRGSRVLHVPRGGPVCQCVKLLVRVTQEILNDELKSRLQQLFKATRSIAELSCLQQVLALLENWECRLQDTATAVTAQA